MERRVTMARSPSSTLPKMNARVALLLCGVFGSAVAYYPERQAPYTAKTNDYNVFANPGYISEPSQRLFFGNGQGSNQVGGTGVWAMLTNKFPWLGNMFGRMELSPEYGVPQVSTQYGVPPRFQPQQFYQAPQVYQQSQFYRAPQTYQAPQVYQQPIFGQRILPGGRDVGFTDDAIIVTPPQVPIAPVQPARPVQPVPLPPQPAPAPAGYNYDKPQYRLELPHK